MGRRLRQVKFDWLIHIWSHQSQHVCGSQSTYQVTIVTLNSCPVFAKMHQALLIQEVVHMVMQNLSNEVEYRKKTKTLYNAALTCSSFLEPALDALWHDMRRLIPLFGLLSNLQPTFSPEVRPLLH